VRLHHLAIRSPAIARGTTETAIVAEATRLGGLLTQAVSGPARPPTAMTYQSERHLLAYAGAVTDFLILDLPKHMRAYDRKAAGSPKWILTLNETRVLRMTHRRTSGHVTASFGESLCSWVLGQLGLATNRDFRRISQTIPPFIGDVCPDFLVRREGRWLPCEAKHVMSDRYLRRSANRGFTQVLSAMTDLVSRKGYLFVAIDGQPSRARYQAETVELYV